MKKKVEVKKLSDVSYEEITSAPFVMIDNENGLAIFYNS